jgi:acyl-CoA thioester hydrolase
MPATQTPSRRDFAFFHEIRVRWAEVDAQGIVFNPNYFMYADIAVTEYMRAVGFPYPQGFAEFGTDTFAVHAAADFRAPAEFDDALSLAVRLARIGRTSLLFEIGVFRGEQLLTEVALTYVNATRESRAPAPVPQPFIDRVLAFEPVPPARK